MTAYQAGTEAQSFLLADCGSSNTTVVLIDVVDGVYRLIARANAPTTATAPWLDITYGLHQAVGRLEAITGRKIMEESGALISPTLDDGSGVDFFALTVSAAKPLRTLMVGLLDEVSLASARRALGNIYALEVDFFSLSDGRKEQAQIDAIASAAPDMIFLAGGTDGGADVRLLQIVETVSLGVSMLDPVDRPEIIFAGNSHIREAVTQMFNNLANVHMADNVRPTLEAEQTYDAGILVNRLYEETKVGMLPGIQDVLHWVTVPIMPTATAFSRVVEYFATLYKTCVLGVDLGSGSTTFISATPDKMQRVIRSDLGMGQPIKNILNLVPLETMRRELPVELKATDVEDFIYNKSLRPHTIPATETDLHLEQAAARAILRQVSEAAGKSWGWDGPGIPPHRIILATGSTLAQAARPGQALLMLLDALQPTGIFSVAIDKYGLLPALGALAEHAPLATVQTLERGALVNLGWVVVPAGQTDEGRKVLDIRMESDRIGVLEIEVPFGTLEVLPLAPGESAQITLSPTRRFDIGQGPGQGQKITISGGLVGLVIDARGRPIDLPEDDAARRSRMRQWHWDMGG